MLVYVCCKHNGSETDNNYLRQCCEQELDMGNIPFAPQLFYPAIAETNARNMSVDLLSFEMLERLDELHVYGSKADNKVKRILSEAQSVDLPVLRLE